MRRTPLLVQFLAFVVVLGVPDGALGVLWPGMRATFHRPVGDLGLVTVAGTLLYVVGGVLFAGVARRVKAATLIVCACALTAASTAGWAASAGWTVLLGSICVFGLGRGVLDAAVNAVAAGQIRHLGWLHAGWSVGGAAGPLLVAGLATWGSWRLAVTVLAIGMTVVSVLAFLAGGGESRPPEPRPVLESPTRQRGSWRRPGVVLLMFGAYTAAEIGPTAWGYVYLTDGRGLDRTSAAVAVAAFWSALTAGRVALGASRRTSDARLVLNLSCSTLAAALALLWLAPTAVAFVAMPLAGLASAAVFPIMVNLTPDLVGTHRSDQTIGLAIAAAAIGGPLTVFVEGQLANSGGVRVLAPAMLVAAAVLVAANVLVLRTHKAAGRGAGRTRTDDQGIMSPLL